jgi:uracil-DNA glycosylase family 4
MTPDERAAAVGGLAEEIRAHRGCGFEPCETCTNPVPGEGPVDAPMMVVGEAPGKREDETGRPFVGAAGHLLDRLLGEAGLAREELFVTNVLKARPPGNRDPRPREVQHSLPWLERQVELVDPGAIVPLGRHALAAFLPGLRITDVHGQVAGEWQGRPVVPLYHPAAALRARPLRAVLAADVARLPALVRV